MLASISGSCPGSRLRESLHENALARARASAILVLTHGSARVLVTQGR
jgi:hypothetical protein